MKWKIFITVCISFFAVSFPANIIGCGPDTDPYDYYTSFFYKELPGEKGYHPFYYTNYKFLYDDTDEMQTSDVLAKEWAGYCGNNVTEKDAKEFVTVTDLRDVNNLYYNIEKAKTLELPDSVLKNSMTSYFLQQKDLEALGYIMYAKKVQPYVIGNGDYWEPISRDSVAMAQLINNGKQLYAAAKKDIFKLKYGYQVVRLAHYSKRYEDAIKWYDEYIAGNKAESILQDISMSLKAGALFRSGKQKEAALLFSKSFSGNETDRISNYISFNWSTKGADAREMYLNYCKTNEEKASMLVLFALSSANNEVPALKQVYEINPKNNALEVLAIREINKLEETYLSPTLNRQKGGASFNMYYDNGTDKLEGKEKEGKELADFLHLAAQKSNVSNPGLFETGAAYMYLMMKDYTASQKSIDAAEKMKLTVKVKDQLALTKLLLTINSKEIIDAGFEEQILLSIKWLQQKAQNEKPIVNGYYDIKQWKTFYRDLMSLVMAKKYHQQGDLYKEALVVGAADKVFRTTNEGYAYQAIDVLHNNLESKDVGKLYTLMTSKNKTSYENYLVNTNTLKIGDVTDFAGTAYLREYNYGSAIEWFKKNKEPKQYGIEKDPFIELLYDQEEALSDEKAIGTKLAFATEMQHLEKKIQTDKTNASKYYYKMALGMYNMTYYGHAWILVEYGRSGSDGYYIPKDANAFKKEYYGCYKAYDCFKKAMDLSAAKEFKAKCLFMMAKCAQKQIRQPQYNEFPDQYEKYEAASDFYWKQFRKNKHFPQLLKEYSGTSFYKKAYNSCSFLRDFVKKK